MNGDVSGRALHLLPANREILLEKGDQRLQIDDVAPFMDGQGRVLRLAEVPVDKADLLHCRPGQGNNECRGGLVEAVLALESLAGADLRAASTALGPLPPAACESVNLLREADAGDPHVRFDERNLETEHGSAHEAPATERAGKQIGRS